MVATPVTTINLPIEEFINETFDFSVSFDNTSTSEGYGPFFDLVVPQGITLGKASYLGAALSVVTYTRTATGWIDGSGAAVTAHPYGSGLTLPTGAVGDKWNLVQLPFGSFVADQPAAEIDFLGNILSKAKGAQVGTGLNLSSRGGFRYGNDALDNAAGDPAIQQSGMTAKTITPKVLELTKDSDAPEEETATGENFARTYILTVNIANGEKIDNLQVKDFLPNNLIYVPGTLSISGATATSIELPTVGAAQNPPNNDFVLNLGSVTGTTSESDVVITYKAYAPKLDANNASVINQASGDDRIALNESQVTGTYGGVAVSDGTKDVAGTKDDPADYTLDLKSIAIQKGVAVVGGGIAKPGAVLEYTLNFQISDYFSFQDININDIFSDGQRFDSSFAPTLIINGNNGTTGSTSFGSFSGDVNGTFTSNNLTGSVATGTNGSTTLNFNVSQRLIDSTVDADGILVGDLVDNLKQSGTTATLVYRTVIQDNFSNQQNLPGYTQDSSVDLADVLTNNVTINGKVVGSNQLEEDTSSASITIPEPTASKEIYAINGVVVSDPAQAKVSPGQTVTYRLKMNLPIADTEKLKLTDYLPLPVFEATELTGSISGFSGIPAAGKMTFGPSHTLNSILPGVIPTFVTNSTQNTIAINFGSFDDPQNRAATIDLLFTVTATDDAFADGLFLTNQAAVEYGSTDDAFKAAVTEIVQVELLEPSLKLTKGVVSSNATSPTFDKTVGPVTFAAPGTAGGAFTGTITSAGLKTTPVDANLTGVDAGDLVRFAIVVENTGGSGAFDAAIKDILPAGLSNPQNLRVTDGAGNLLTYTGDLFGSNGLTLTDDADGALDKGRTGTTATTNGKNIIVITYDATVDSSIQPKQTLTSGAEILQFAGKEGGTDHTANATNSNWVNTASTTVATPKVTLNLVGTEVTNATNSNTQAVIGELAEYELVLTVPEGVTPTATLVNTLPAGLSFADFTGLTVSSGLTSSTVTNVDSLLSNTSTSSNSFTVNFGTLTNSNSSNATPETITLRFRAVVSNLASNQNNTGLNHVASNVKFNWNNGTAQLVTATEADNVSNNVTVVEPDVTIAKDVVVNGSGNKGDAGDPYEYTITLSHQATNPDAYDITFKDVLNSKLATGATLTSVTDSANILNTSNFEIVGGTLQLKSGVDLDLVGSRTITVKVSGNLSATVIPNETLNTPATVTWTSLNGTVTNRSSVASVINDDERTGTGGVNDYTKSDDAPIVVENVEPIKSIASTSETATTNKILDANGRTIGDDVAIGEIVRYRLVTRLSEGQIDNLQIKDNLPPGLRFIDGTAKAALVNTTTNNLSTSDSGLSGSIVANIANPDTFIPTFVLPDANVSASDSADNDTYTSGTDIFFKFGNISNTGTNSGSEYVVIEFDALVLDEAGNTAAKTLANNFDVSIGGTKVNTSTDATVKVVAPQLSITQVLTVNGGTTGDAGDLATITLTVKNTGTANAYEVKLEDVLDATKFDITNASSVSLPAGFSFDKNTPGKIVYSSGSIAKGATETFTFTVPLKTAVNAGETLVSQAKITEATTINGTPISGVERDIANPDILANDQQLTINKPLLATELVGTQLNNTSNSNTEAVIGEIVTYRTTITVPEGTTAAAVLKDTLDAGLAFVGFTSITSSSGVTASNIANVSDLNTKATVGANGADFTLNLGNLVNTNNTNGTPETIVIEYQAVVLNTAANQSTAKESGPQLNNAATLNWTGNTTPLSAAAANVTVIEPLLQVIKDVTLDGAGTTGNGGDEVVYTITIKHSANSEADAYDVNLSDVLPAEFVSGNSSIEIVSDNTGSTLTNNDFQISGGNPATGGTAGGTLQLVNGKTLNIPEGKEIVLKVTGKVSDKANLGQTFDSPAQITWNSLSGTQSNLSPYTATGDEERTGTGSLNNYFAQDNAPATIENLTNVTKVLTSTSVGNDANKTVTVGEILTYTVTITVPEGTTPNLKLVDTLDPGLAFVDVVSIASSAGVTSSAGAFASSMGTISNVSSADIDKGRVLTANLGNVTNSNSNENTPETIAITYRAVVLNANLVNDGTTHDNSAVVSWTAAGTPQSLTVKAGAVTVSEPKLALEVQVLDDNGNPTENVRGNIGDTVTVRVTVSSNGSDAFEADAFDLAFSNSIPGGMTFVPGSITPVSGATPTTSNFSGGKVNVGYTSFTDGSTSVFTFQVTLDGTVTTGDITNSGQLTYTSIAGNVGTITPNNPLAGERTGDTALIGGAANDLRETNTASVTLNLPPTTLDGSDRVVSEDTVQIPGLGGSDANAGGTVQEYKIDTLPAVGTLYLGNPQNGGTSITVGLEIPANQIGNLFYTAPAGFTGTTFTYSAIDNEAFKDPTSAIVTLSPNTPPATVNATDHVEPLGTVNLEGLNGSDTDGTVANYEITSLPPVGSLYLGNPQNGGTLVTVGQLIPPDKIDELFFSAPNGFTGTTFTYTSVDNDGGKDKTPATVTIQSNQPPETQNALQNIPLNATTKITGLTNPLGGSDADGTVAKYKITSLPDPIDGELYLGNPNNGGTAVTLNQEIPVNKIGNLYFKSTGTFNGSSFTYTSVDNDGTVDATPAVVNLNAPPETVDGNYTAAPNATISLPGLGGSDPDSIVAFYTIKSLPTGGVLYLGSAIPANAITVGKTLTPVEISQLVFKADGTFNGSTSFTYAATDNYGLPDVTPATVTIVSPNGNLPPSTVNGSQTVEPGTAAILAGLSGSDADGTVTKYRIDTLPDVADGVLYLGSANPGNAVKAGQEIPAGQIGNLVFVANPGFNGGSFTYSAIDDDNTADPTPATFTLNTPPTTIDSIGKVNPNNTLQIPGLGGNDADGTVIAYTIETLPPPAQGTLYLGNPASGGTAVTVGQTLQAAQIGNLFFQATGTFTGTSFTYSATDNSGAKDTTPATVNLTPDGVNIAPTTVNVEETVVPGTTANLTELTGSDADGTVDKYRIDTLPDAADGVLYLGGNAVTLGQEIPANQIGNLTFEATPGFNGGSFTYSSIDNTGTPDPTPATVILNAPPETPGGIQTVAPNTNVLLTVPTGSDPDGTVTQYRIDTLPDVADGVLYLGNPNLGNAVTAGQVLTPTQLSQLVFQAKPGFNGGSFTYSSIDNTGTPDPTPATFVLNVPPETVNAVGKVNLNDTLNLTGLTGSDIDGTVASYTLNTLPPATQGTLYLGNPASGGTAVTPGQVIPAAQIGNLFFQATGTFTGTSFTYTATDNNGGVDATPATVTLAPEGVNIAPTTVNVEETVVPGTTANLTELTGSDADGTVDKYRIDTLPDATDGVLYLGGNAVTLGQEIPANQIGNLTFEATPGFNGGSFTYSSIDNTGTPDPTPATVILNAPPETLDGSKTVNPNTRATLTGMGGSDADGTVVNYRIDTLPPASQGVLYLGANAIAPGQVLTLTQLSQLAFQATGNFTGSTFTYRAIDNTGTPDPTPATYTLSPGNVAPNTDNALNKVNPTETVNLTGLGGSDSDGTVAYYTITSLPPGTQGTLYLGNPAANNPVKVGDILTPNQIQQLSFQAAVGFTGTTFTYKATDDDGASDGTPATVTLRPDNLPPNTIDRTQEVTENTTTPLTGLGGNDPDGTISFYTIESLPSQGTLYLGDPANGGTTVSIGQTLTPFEIGQLYFQSPAGYTGSNFNYTATDNNGAQDPTPATVFLPVPGGNLPPETNLATGEVIPGNTWQITGLGGSDPNSDPIAQYQITTLPNSADGELYLGDPDNGGVKVSLNDQIPADQIGNLYFKSTGTFDGATFTYAAIDPSNAQDPTPATVTISPLGNNQPPDTDDVTATTNPGGSISLIDLEGSDPDGTVALYKIDTLPPTNQGKLYLDDPVQGKISVAEGQILTPNQLKLLTFEASGGFTGTSFTYSAIDNDGGKDPTPATVTIASNLPQTQTNLPPQTENASQVVVPGDTNSLTGLSGSDPDGTVALYQITSLPNGGTLYIGDPAHGGIPVTLDTIFTPTQLQHLVFDAQPGFKGTTFTYAAIDNDGAKDTTPATVTLTAGNAPPETQDAIVPVSPNSSVSLAEQLVATDPDGNVKTYTILTLPGDGQLFLNSNPVNAGDKLTPAQLSSLTFNAGSTFTHTHFTYTATDEDGDSDRTPATIFLKAPGANLPPVAPDASIPISPGTTIDLPDFQATDPDGTIKTYTIDTLPTGGKLYLGNPANGGTPVSVDLELTGDDIKKLFFQADGTFKGSSFTYTATDDAGDTDTGTITLTGGNNPPTTQSVNANFKPGETRLLTGLSGSDSDGSIAYYTITSIPSGGTLYLGNPKDGVPIKSGDVLTPDQIKLLVFQSGSNFTGTSFTYTATDNLGLTDPTPATVTIGTLGNPAPELTPELTPEPTPELTPEPTPELTSESTPEVLVGKSNLEAQKCQECCPVAPTIGGLEIAPLQPIVGTDIAPPIKPDTSQFSRTNSSDGDDQVRGSDDQDEIWGDRGNDTLAGQDGDDRLAGDSRNLSDADASGDDWIYGGAGNDELNGNEKNDTLSGGNGDDEVHGGRDNDLLSGDSGNDTLGGDRGNDTILGSLGRFTGVGSQEEQDKLYGNQGRDLLKGGEGEDSIYGGKDDDLAYGGKDDDLLEGELGNDTLTGDEGDDTLRGSTEDPSNPDPSGRDLIYGAAGRDVLFGNESNDTLSGGNSDDRIHGGKDGDLMFGDEGNDTLYGERGDDTLLGSLGKPTSASPNSERDLLSGNDGNDILKGGEGDDSIYAGKDNDLVYAGKDNDLVFGDQGSDTLVGDQGNDTISGGNGKPDDPEDANGHDVIFGGDGEDVIDGNLGNDSIITGSGNDHAMGGRGDDILWGEAGNDLLFGDLGNDTLCGGDGDDILVGSNGDPGNTGDGNDMLCGGAGNDRLYGNEGEDTLNGGGDDDCLFGGKGNDLLKGVDGNDQLFGEEGNDTLIGGDGNDVFVLRQGSGTDTVEDFKLGEDRIGLVGLTFENLRISQGTTGAEIRANGELLAILLGVSATALTSASFTTELRCAVATKTEDCGCPTVPTIDGLAIKPLVDTDLDLQIQAKRDIGGDDIDILQGSIQNDRFDGRDSADRLSGYLGNDELYGNQGSDSISSGDGDDRAHGGQDGDLISGALGNDTLYGERGNDTLLGSLGSSNGIGRSGERDLLSGNDGNDIIKGGEGDDHIYAGKNDDLVYAGKDNDLVFGDWGSDTLVGDDGDDTLVGGNGDPNVPESANSNDLIFGGAGNDSLNGNEGNDSLVGGVGDDESRGGKGNDVIWGESGNDLLLGELGSDTLCGGDGDDTLVGSNGNPEKTGDSSDKLCGGAGNDVVYANEGDDRLDGDSGDDTLLGGQQNDTLSGGAGNDFLAGEQGSDRLLGGEGSDLFQIIIGGVDTIADFQVGVDQIVLTGSLTWEQLTLTQVNNSTMIRLGTEQLAILEGVRVDRVSDLN
jgi:fimbrial isopeptide formation D2 family protein/uncharacterized repeat protein (TIGR01451 family)